MFRIPMNTENYLESTKNHLSSNGIFSKDLQRCTFSKRFQNMLKIESSPCSTISIWLRKDIAWNVFRILTWSEITQRNFCWDIGLFSVLVKRNMVWNGKLRTWRTVQFYRCHGLQLRRQPTSILQSFLCVGSWAMYDSLHRGSFKCRTFISHDHCCTSAQYPRSDRWLVW